MKTVCVPIEVPSSGYCVDYNTKERCVHLDDIGRPTCRQGFFIDPALENTRGIMKAIKCDNLNEVE